VNSNSPEGPGLDPAARPTHRASEAASPQNIRPGAGEGKHDRDCKQRRYAEGPEQQPDAPETFPADLADCAPEIDLADVPEPPPAGSDNDLDGLRDLEADEHEQEPTASDAERIILWVAGVGAIAALVAFVPTGWFFGRLVGSCAVIGGALQGVEAQRWHRKGYFDKDYLRTPLRRILAGVQGGLLALTLTGFLAPPAHAIILLSPWVWAAATASHFLTPRLINRLISEAGPANRPVPRVRQYWWFDAPAKDLVLREEDPAGGRCSKVASVGSWGRRVLALALPVVLLILSGTGFALAVATHDWLGEPTAAEIAEQKREAAAEAEAKAQKLAEAQIRAAREQEATERETQREQARDSEAPGASPGDQPSPGSSESQLVQPLLPAPEEWDGTCTKVTQRSRGVAKATHTIEDLLEDTELTSKQEGCIGQVTPHSYLLAHQHHRERYFTSVNTNQLTGAKLSFAIDSEGFAALLVSWQMAPAIKQLLAKYGPVGGDVGFPDYPVAAGDFYLIKTRAGTFVFIRREPGEPYRELPPTAARGWLGEIKNAKEFLWPAAGVPGDGSEKRFVLRADEEGSEGEGVATVHWYPSGFAWRGTYQYPFEPVRELNKLELLKYAAAG
jgi:hypothetical protein